MAVQASTIVDRHINHGVLGGTRVIPQHEQTRRLRRDPTSENDVRNAIERTTVSATRIEILVSESVVAEGDELDLRSFRIETPNHISVDAERHDGIAVLVGRGANFAGYIGKLDPSTRAIQRAQMRSRWRFASL